MPEKQCGGGKKLSSAKEQRKKGISLQRVFWGSSLPTKLYLKRFPFDIEK